MPDLIFETFNEPPAEVIQPIERGLHAYNLSILGPEVNNGYARVAITVRDGEDGPLAGGLVSEIFWGWMHIQTLWVAEGQRGKDIGTRLMRQAEEAALARGVRHLTLETTSFQALDFYRKNGYEVCGEIADRPQGHSWYYLKKIIMEEEKPE